MISPKLSRAPRIWFLIVLLVLTTLFFETRGTGRRNTNFFLSGDSDAIGAEVFVDGMKLGKIANANNSGLSGGNFCCHISNGNHLLEIKKPGFITLSKTLNIAGQDYLSVDLERSGSVN